MYPRSLSTVSLCILNNWPFCRAETETGTAASVEATHASVSRGEGWGCRSYQGILLLHVPVDICLPHHMTRLSYSALQCHFAELLPLTSSLHKSGEPLGPGTSPPPLCAPRVWEGFLQILLFPRGRLFSPILLQSTYLSTHHLPSQRLPSAPEKIKFPPRISPGTLQTALCCPFWQSRMELTQKWHVQCDRPTKMSCVWTNVPDAMEGSLGRASFVRASIPLLMPEQNLPLSWRTSSFCRAEGQPGDSRTEVFQELIMGIPLSSPLNTRKLRALLPALPLLGWQTWAPPG